MLNVQKYLLEHGLAKLQEEFAIKITEHPELPLVILNYDQIDSPRKHYIADECRGLVLEKDTWKIVARSFSRFYNYGEFPDKDKDFVFNRAVATSKEDGSIILLYNYNNEWFINTRSTFGDKSPTDNGKSWKELISPLVDFNKLDKNKTYVCEFCSPLNMVVRLYKKTYIIFTNSI